MHKEWLKKKTTVAEAEAEHMVDLVYEPGSPMARLQGGSFLGMGPFDDTDEDRWEALAEEPARQFAGRVGDEPGDIGERRLDDAATGEVFGRILRIANEAN